MNRLIVLLTLACGLMASPFMFPDAADGQSKKVEPKPGLPKTTQNGVEYELLSSQIVGDNWEVTLSALSEEGNRTIRFRSSRAITEEGQSYENKFLKMKALKLPVGQKVQIKLDMGSLPVKVNKLATVELQDAFTRGKATVFKNVRVDR